MKVMKIFFFVAKPQEEDSAGNIKWLYAAGKTRSHFKVMVRSPAPPLCTCY